MATMKSKGTVLAKGSGGSYTAIPGIQTIDKSGEEGESTEARTLDGGAGLVMASTGFVKPPVISGTLLYDAANSVHAGLKTLMRTPADTNFKITYTDAGPVSEIWNVVTVGFDESVDGTKVVSAKFKLTCSGTAS